MKFLPTNVLGYFNAAPQTHLHDFSKLPVAVFSASTLKYRDNCGQTIPTEEAVTFYTLNHCASVIRKAFTENEPLPEWAQDIMAMYTGVCMAQGERMLHYLLSITTREMRHLKSCTPTFWGKVEKEFDANSVVLLKDISSNPDETAAVNKFMKTPPAITIGQYTQTLAYAFHKAGSAGWNGSYGGQPWGNVTDSVVSFLSGITSMEMMVDTGYTLAHNGGPIFDKGMMYSHHNAQQLLTILDVQRSGQCPDLMLEANTLGIAKTPEAVKAVSLIQQYYPVDGQGKATIKGWMDWKLVDELRPDKDKQAQPNKYSKLTTAQTQPKTPKPATVKAPATAKVMTTLAGQTVKMVGTWQVYKDQSITQVERVK